MTPAPSPSPLLTLNEIDRMALARQAGTPELECSLDLQRSITRVDIGSADWGWSSMRFPYPEGCKARSVYYWTGEAFRPVSRYSSSLIKLIPTEWGAPTFEIDGIKMLPSQERSPYVDAELKVSMIDPRGKRILDTCGGLGYFAAWCLRLGAAHVLSCESNPDVIWLRGLNPWSPPPDSPLLTLILRDVTEAVAALEANSVDAVLHDPPRIGIAGNLYSRDFYDHLARVLRRRGKLFHYTGTPNKLTSGRDVPREVAKRLKTAGFTTEKTGDGILAVKR